MTNIFPQTYSYSYLNDDCFQMKYSQITDKVGYSQKQHISVYAGKPNAAAIGTIGISALDFLAFVLTTVFTHNVTTHESRRRDTRPTGIPLTAY